MNKQTHKLVRGPHLLFTGANGHKCYGITVRHLDEAMAKKSAYQVEFNYNDHTLITNPPEEFLFIGESLESIKAIQAEVKKLSEEQT
jgi:hypothetical protein